MGKREWNERLTGHAATWNVCRAHGKWVLCMRQAFGSLKMLKDAPLCENGGGDELEQAENQKMAQ